MTKEEKLLPELLQKHESMTRELITSTEFIRSEIVRLNQELGDIEESEKYCILKNLEVQIKSMVLSEMKTARTAVCMFVYNKGRATWDTKKLKEYAKKHPAVKQFQKTGKPSVSIKKVSK